MLNHHYGMPETLFVAGKIPDNRQPTVAIIGSRKPTPYGKEVTYRLAYDLAKRGVVVVSGLAYGVDAIAHQAALDADGTTIAVLANGLHKVYPQAHTGLAEQIIRQGGALVSEQAMGIEAQKYHFLARNRIVSGLADAVIVTEATDRSGTFSTVSHALTQNKEVFAVPGPITSLLSAGPNRLLQEGARVVLSAKDILQVIAPDLLNDQQQRAFGDNELEHAILNLIKAGKRTVDDLLQSVDAPGPEVMQAITYMELKGTIAMVAGNLSIKK